MSNRSFAAMRQEADRIIERYKAQVARQVASINRLLTIRQGYLDLIGKIKYTLQILEPDAQVLNRIIELIQEFENQSEEGKEMGQNLEPEKLPLIVRPAARLLGVTAPVGKAPLYLRMIIKRKREEAKAAAERLVAFEPKRVIFSHGRWFHKDGAALLRQSLEWLL